MKATTPRRLMCGHPAALTKAFQRNVLTGPPGRFLLGRRTKATLVLVFLTLRRVRTRYSFQINSCRLGFQTFGNRWKRFLGLPWNDSSNPGRTPRLALGAIQAFLRAAVYLRGARTSPWHWKFSLCPPMGKGKDSKVAMLTGLASSRSTAVTSRPARSRRTGHRRPAPRPAGPGPGCCRRWGRAGRTLSRSPPPRPAALRSRR